MERRTTLSAEALAGLEGRKALLVDDDIRNVFALTSALEQYGMNVVHAETGREGIETLKRERGVGRAIRRSCPQPAPREARVTR